MINVLGRSIRAPSVLARLVLAAGVSASLMFLDHKGQHLEKIRSALVVLVYPLQLVAGLPAATAAVVADFFTGEHTLKETNERLHAERELLRARLQQFEALEEENNRLRKMLGSATRIADKALAAELLEVSPEPFSRKIIVAKGSRSGAYVGQPVIDAHGIMGQVTQVAAHQSRVTLITDPGHAIPVLVNRSGLRALVFGTGDQDTLRVRYLTSGTDIKEGDLLVSSGMGGTFPPNYPVAQVTHIEDDPNESFLAIRARPVAQLNHSKQVLLVWPGGAHKTAKEEK
jgi:rod shape-determining protein MreC